MVLCLYLFYTNITPFIESSLRISYFHFAPHQYQDKKAVALVEPAFPLVRIVLIGHSFRHKHVIAWSGLEKALPLNRIPDRPRRWHGFEGHIELVLQYRRLQTNCFETI
jgi:hypothetical protein